MGLKFLNKKGWHTGSLRNIENVWKAEQKHGAEQKKLEELRKQIQEERERSEFRQLQEQAGLVPRQERLEFLYDSGLSVGKGNSEGFKALEPKAAEEPQKASSSTTTATTKEQQPSAPGALFEDKPHSANDAWRKLHSDPLLMIRQREQEALARVKNNPVQMAMIRKSVEAKLPDKKKSERKKSKEKKSRHKKKSKHHKDSSPERDSDSEDADTRKSSKYDDEHSDKEGPSSRKDAREKDKDRRRNSDKDINKHRDQPASTPSNLTTENLENHSKYNEHCDSGRMRREERNNDSRDRSSKYSDREDRRGYHHERSSKYDDKSDKEVERPGRENRERDGQSRRNVDEDYVSRRRVRGEDQPKRNHDKDSEPSRKGREEEERPSRQENARKSSDMGPPPREPYQRRRNNGASKLSEEERAARLKEMQMDAELHEEQRWKRLKKADEVEAAAATAGTSTGKSFLDAAQRSVYGAEKGGSSTIEESLRRRTHYSQKMGEGNAFRR